VVLARSEDVQPDLFGLLCDRDHRLDPLGLGRHPTGRRISSDITDREDSELHASHSLGTTSSRSS